MMVPVACLGVEWGLHPTAISLLSKALNVKYKARYMRDCLDFCFFANVVNFFATKKNTPLRCVTFFVDSKVPYDELRIKKIEVRTHSGDPS